MDERLQPSMLYTLTEIGEDLLDMRQAEHARRGHRGLAQSPSFDGVGAQESFAPRNRKKGK